MKKLAIALMLASSVAFADEVTVTGYGSTFDNALANAKMQALEKVTGTFIISESEYKNKQYKETVDQYNGGIINKYDIISSSKKSTGYEVTIVADVDRKKDNRMNANKPVALNVQQQDYKEKQKVFDRLDDFSKAVSIQLSQPTYNVGRNSTTVNLNVAMSFQPKWVSDMKSFGKVIDEEGKTSSNIYPTIHGGVVATLMSLNPFAAIAVAEVGKPKQAEQSDDTMVCFAKTKNSSVSCQSIGVDFRNIHATPRIVVYGSINGKDVELWSQYAHPAFYEVVYAGDKRATWFKNINNTYNQPALLVYEKEQQIANVRFVIDNNQMDQIKNIKVVLQ